MSSHPIVRENQEPAVYLSNPDAVTEHVIDSLLEWTPLVICAEEALSFVLKKWIKIDLFVVEDTSYKWQNLLAHQWPVELLPKSGLPINLLEFLRGKGIRYLNYIGDFEEISKSSWPRYFNDIRLDVFSGHCRYHYISCGSFEKWMSPGRGLYLKSQAKKPQFLTKNVHALGVHKFKVEKEGVVSIESDAPIWVGEVVL